MTTSGFYALTLVSRKREFEQVYSLRFTSENPVPFVPGQYLHFLAPASPPGRENVRHLSIASVPEERELLFSLDFNSRSEFKDKLSGLQLGGRAHVFKVKGAFILDAPQQRPIRFLAGGLGITPIRSLILQLRNNDPSADWRLLHVASADFLYQEEISNWGGSQYRVHRQQLGNIIPDWVREEPNALWYVSGSGRFIDGMSARLRESGLPESQLRLENFSH